MNLPIWYNSELNARGVTGAAGAQAVARSTTARVKVAK
jgi:hypothetical protein